MKSRIIAAAALSAVLATGAADAGAGEFSSDPAPLGHGSVSSYAVIDASGAPSEIGVHFAKGALEGLPAEHNKTSRCFDLDGNGAINDHGECEGDYESRLPIPAVIAGHPDNHFVFAMVNWNPGGHPPAAWQVPHFDIHFYSVDPAVIDSIRLGNCGIFIDCEDLEKATAPVPAKYVNPDHADVGAAVGRMGNHLIDTKTPELGNPPVPFTHTWIFGAYDAKVIFHEVMVTRDFLMDGGDACHPIKQPEAWERAGYYPTSYCFRHLEDGSLKVYMEGFVKRTAG